MDVRTIPHTGTNFVQWLFAKYGVPWRHQHIVDWRYPLNPAGKVVITVRDPIMVRISTLNRHEKVPIRLFSLLPPLLGSENVFFFPVDLHRERDLDKLADFCGVERFETDWAPKNSHPDTLGLKERYLAGEIPPQLAPDFEWLAEHPEIAGFFGALGYPELGWM